MDSKDASAISTNQMARAKAAYVQNCQACHGVERAGMALIPALTNLSARVPFGNFRTVVAAGKGQMPGFPHLDEGAVTDLYAYLTDASVDPNAQRRRQRPGEADSNAAQTLMTNELVVASGGAPGSQRAEGQRRDFGRGSTRGYPEGVVGPTNRYSTGYGLEYPNLLSPPWSIIAAYDLNKGTIKWKRALGQDSSIARQSGEDTGVPNGSQRKGMIVTSTGLLFASCKDGKIYCYDADNGDVLWSTQLPRHPEGLLAMYEVNGRQYLEVCSMDFVIDKSKEPALPAGYIVFALPKTGKQVN
jgi:quinoprotein glucose dehydrogenase